MARGQELLFTKEHFMLPRAEKEKADWLENGLKELYFFMHMHDEAYSPELSVYLIDTLNTVCNLSLQKPKFL